MLQVKMIVFIQNSIKKKEYQNMDTISMGLSIMKG